VVTQVSEVEVILAAIVLRVVAITPAAPGHVDSIVVPLIHAGNLSRLKYARPQVLIANITEQRHRKFISIPPLTWRRGKQGVRGQKMGLLVSYQI